MERTAAVDRVVELLDTVERDRMPVPVREVWVTGDLALGVDPIDRLEVYLAKDVLIDGSEDDELVERYGVRGIGSTVQAEWVREHLEFLEENANGYAAPERCLASHLVGDDEPIHLEVCNAGFEDNVRQRLRGAKAREAYDEVIDPRGVCLWIDGIRSDDAIEKLREGSLPFPPLSTALESLGLGAEEAQRAAEAVHAWREKTEGATVRGDVI